MSRQVLTLIKLGSGVRNTVIFEKEVFVVQSHDENNKQLSVVTTRYDSPLIRQSRDELIEDYRNRGYHLKEDLCRAS